MPVCNDIMLKVSSKTGLMQKHCIKANSVDLSQDWMVFHCSNTKCEYIVTQCSVQNQMDE